MTTSFNCRSRRSSGTCGSTRVATRGVSLTSLSSKNGPTGAAGGSGLGAGAATGAGAGTSGAGATGTGLGASTAGAGRADVTGPNRLGRHPRSGLRRDDALSGLGRRRRNRNSLRGRLNGALLTRGAAPTWLRRSAESPRARALPPCWTAGVGCVSRTIGVVSWSPSQSLPSGKPIAATTTTTAAAPPIVRARPGLRRWRRARGYDRRDRPLLPGSRRRRRGFNGWRCFTGGATTGGVAFTLMVGFA